MYDKLHKVELLLGCRLSFRRRRNPNWIPIGFLLRRNDKRQFINYLKVQFVIHKINPYPYCFIKNNYFCIHNINQIMKIANNSLTPNIANHGVVSLFASTDFSVSLKNITLFEMSASSATALSILANSELSDYSGDPLQWETFSKSASNGK